MRGTPGCCTGLQHDDISTTFTRKFLLQDRYAKVKNENSARIHRTGVAAVSLIFMLAGISSALAEGSIEAGKSKSVACAACHGQDGNSINAEWPVLAGQHANYIVNALKTFKTGERNNPLMSGQAAMLTEQDMNDLAAYFSAQTPAGGTADAALAVSGERLYRGGNPKTGVSACAACHGPTGTGNGPAGYPRLAGQHAAYTTAQLNAFRSGQRKTDASQMMRNIAALMTDEEIKAVASYIQGLR